MKWGKMVIGVIVNLFSVTLIMKIFNRLYSKKIIGVVALKRDDKTIVTIFSVIALIRYIKNGFDEEFKKDCKKFLKLLDGGKTYYTETHSLILKELKLQLGEENVTYTKVKKRRMILSKLSIGNTKKLWRKYQYYKVTFKIPINN